MERRPIPPSEVLHALLRYDPETGLLFWRTLGIKWFRPTKYLDGERPASWQMNRWNTRFAGKEAFGATCHKGYKIGTIRGKRHRAHRIIYAMHHHLFDESMEIDHINGDKCDNRIENLRAVTSQKNMRNMPLYSSNKSGFPGVMWEDSHKAWAVKININGKQRRIGRFKIKAEAVAARKNAEMVHGYHPNHGRRAAGG